MIEVKNLTKANIDTALLKKTAERILKKEKANGDVSIALVQPKRSKELNRIYRGKNKVANVLTFPSSELGLGEIVICPQEVRKDAKKYGMVIKQELQLMVIHGVLHLLGYNHKIIERKEQEYLS